MEKPFQTSRSVFDLLRSVLFGMAVLIVVAVGLVWGLFYAVEQGKLQGRRRTSMHQLQQIAIAMRHYHSEHGQLPRAYYLSAKGERTLSWRVALLPYLEQTEVFNAIDVAVPWDQQPKPELKRYPVRLYKLPLEDDTPLTETSYLVITGPGTMFEEGKDLGFAQCTDGTSNTIVAVEVLNSGVHWAQPRDLDIRTMAMRINGSSPNGISSPWSGGAQVVMADGTVKFLSNNTLESTLRAMITRSGGEPIETPD